jgi:hypothetical protein
VRAANARLCAAVVVSALSVVVIERELKSLLLVVSTTVPISLHLQSGMAAKTSRATESEIEGAPD